MTLYKITIHNREYTSWSIYHTTTLEMVELPGLHPLEYKLLTGDVFTYNKGKVELVHSSLRLSDSISAVLILTNNKTYGSKKGKLLYKCIPDDIRIPSFLIPYEMKRVGFSKAFINMYVVIRFHEWIDKHPMATICHVIGTVDVLDNFYEYQLYCKSLNASIQRFTKDTSKVLKEHTSTKESDIHYSFIESLCKEHKEIENRTNNKEWEIFTIDPSNSVDLDDGFSIKTLENGQTLLSIYISNVTVWLDKLNLWDSFSRRISTIYLPDRKRPMLPTILSDCLCSLLENTSRIAFVMDLYITNGVIESIQYSNCIIRVDKNYVYEDPALLENPSYHSLFSICKQLSKTYKYITNVRNSHDVVCYLMILMNYHCAKKMISYKNGIFRSTIIKKEVQLPNGLPEEVDKFIRIWNSASGQYVDLNRVITETPDINIENVIRHDMLEMDSYIHITSPIRRLVDLLNMIQIQQNTGLLSLSPNAILFYEKWIAEMDYINITMRSIRKVQNDCHLLHLCHENATILDKNYDGYCFDKIARNDGLFQFIVFLPELRLSCRLTLRDNLENYQKNQYKLFLFNDESTFKKKIRLQFIYI